MPMMMETGSFHDTYDEMDDLFLGSQSDIDQQQQQQPQAPPKVTKKLLQRLEELSVKGCCQKMAWSKFGSLASINGVEPGVSVRGFAQDHDKHDFELTEPVSVEFPPLYDTRDIIHVCWSHNGLDLAVVDAGGRINLFTIYICVNRLVPLANYTPNPTDALEAIVGFEWLCPLRPFAVYPSATRKGDSWTYHPDSPKIGGPIHPVTHKQALFFVTRGGKVNLLYMDWDNSLQVTSAPLGMSGYIDSLLTHAAFSLEQDKSALLATYDVLETLRVYRITVDWNYPFGGNDQPPQPPPGYHIQPTLNITRLSSLSNSESQLHNSEKAVDAEILHLKVFPAMGSSNNGLGPSSLPTVMALRAVIQDSAESDVGTLSYYTSVSRWDVHEAVEEIHSSFQQLSVKRKKSVSAAPEKRFRIQQLETIRLEGSVNSVDTTRFNTIVAFCKMDGSIEFRNRSTFQPIQIDKTDNIESLLSVGFHMPAKDTCLHTCLSPNACITVSKNESDELHLRSLEPPAALAELADSDPLKTAVVAAFCLAMASASFQHLNSDDVLSLLQQNQAAIGTEKPIDGIYISLGIPVDSAGMENPEKLLRSHIILRCLSSQDSLGRSGKYRNISSKLASIILSLRSSSWALHFGFNNAQTPQQSFKLDLPTSLIGVARWYFDLMVFVVADLLEISRRVKGHESDLGFIQQCINEYNSPTIPLLLSSIPRVLLRYDSRCLRSVLHAAQKYTTMAPIDATTNAHPSSNRNIQTAWRTLFALLQTSPIEPRKFETALEDVEHHVKTSYEAGGFGEAQRVAAERKMLTSGTIPEVLTPVVTRLVTVTLERLAEGCDITKVRFTDTSWLGIGGSNTEPNPYDESKWDVLRKVPLNVRTSMNSRRGQDMPLSTTAGTGIEYQIRRCTRCGSHMEDLLNPRQMMLPHWILQLQKGCICGCPWVRISTPASGVPAVTISNGHNGTATTVNGSS